MLPSSLVFRQLLATKESTRLQGVEDVNVGKQDVDHAPIANIRSMLQANDYNAFALRRNRSRWAFASEVVTLYLKLAPVLPRYHHCRQRQMSQAIHWHALVA